MSEEMAPAEVGRVLKRLEDSQVVQTNKLDEIIVQTTRTNGRVDRLEDDVRDLKRGPRTDKHDLKRISDRTDVITVQIPAGALSAKTITTVVAGVLAGLIAAWKAGLFQ